MLKKKETKIPVIVSITVPVNNDGKTENITRPFLLINCNWNKIMRGLREKMIEITGNSAITVDDMKINFINEISIDFYNMLCPDNEE